MITIAGNRNLACQAVIKTKAVPCMHTNLLVALHFLACGCLISAAMFSFLNADKRCVELSQTDVPQ